MKKKEIFLSLELLLQYFPFAIKSRLLNFTRSNIFQPTSSFTQPLHITPISYQTNSLLVPNFRKFSSKFQILQRTLWKLTAQD